MKSHSNSKVNFRGAATPPAAFTLIELLAVVAIIGLLIAIIVPAMSGARDQARAVTCLSNLRSLGTGFLAYATSERDYLCSGQADARPGMNLDPAINDLEQTAIEKIGWIADQVNGGYGFPGLMLCPTNPGRITQSWGRAFALRGAAARYPAESFRRLIIEDGYNSNYCQSWYMAHTQYDGHSSPVVNHDLMFGSMGPLRTSMMSRAPDAGVPLLADARAANDEVFNHSPQGYGPPMRETKSVTDGPGWDETADGSYVPAPYSSLTPYGIQDWDDFGPAHRRRSINNDEQHGLTVGNILFADGHVESFADRFDFDNGRIKVRPDGELDSWDLRSEVFDGVLSLGRRSMSVRSLE